MAATAPRRYTTIMMGTDSSKGDSVLTVSSYNSDASDIAISNVPILIDSLHSFAPHSH